MGLLAAQGVTEGAVGLLAESLLFNFFSLFAIVFALGLALTGWGFGPMRKAEVRAATTGEVTRPGSTPMIAEEVAEVLPELAVFDAEGRPVSVKYRQLSTLLLNELQRKHRHDQLQWGLLGAMLLAGVVTVWQWRIT